MAAAATYRHDPWGRQIASTGTVANPYRCGGSYGAYTDLSTGLVKIGQRYYDPNLGRWTQRDPPGADNSRRASMAILVAPIGALVALRLRRFSPWRRRNIRGNAMRMEG